jgi:hypothetical protein
MRNWKVGVDVRWIFKRVPKMVAMDFVTRANLHAVRWRLGIIAGRLTVGRAHQGSAHDDGEDNRFGGAHV